MIQDLGSNPLEGIVPQPESKYGETGIELQLLGIRTMVHLSPKAKNLLIYIFNNMSTNYNVVTIDRDEYMKFSGITSKATVVTAIAELMKKKVIAKTCKQKLYWTNPNMFTVI